MRTAKDLLVDARKLVETAWNQHSLAQNGAGLPTYPSDPDACSFCLLGSIYGANARGEMASNPILTKAIHAASGFFDYVGQSFASWNDAPERTKEEVLSVIDKAIEKLERQT